MASEPVNRLKRLLNADNAAAQRRTELLWALNDIARRVVMPEDGVAKILMEAMHSDLGVMTQQALGRARAHLQHASIEIAEAISILGS